MTLHLALPRKKSEPVVQCLLVPTSYIEREQNLCWFLKVVGCLNLRVKSKKLGKEQILNCIIVLFDITSLSQTVHISLVIPFLRKGNGEKRQACQIHKNWTENQWKQV